MERSAIRYYELDLLRFIAAMAIVLYHFLFRGQYGDFMPVVFQPFNSFAQYGLFGLHLFFMISGFVILMSATNRTAWQFLISRISRLYPGFWASVSLSALVMVVFGQKLFSIDFSQYLMNLTMLGGFIGVEDIDGVYWTLYLELKFYALIFVVLLFNKMEKIELILVAWLLIQLLNLIIPLPGFIVFFVFPEWAPYFVGGASFYLLKAKGPSLLRVTNLLVAFYLSLRMGIESFSVLNSIYDVESNFKITTITISFFYLIFTLLVFDKLSWIRSKAAVKIGALTYPLYLIHQNIGYIAFNYFYESINKYVLLALVIAFLLLVSWVINVAIERRFGPMIKRSLESSLKRFTKSSPVTAR